MLDFVPPIALIRRICYPTSVRLPQRTLLGLKVPKKVIPPVVQSRFAGYVRGGETGKGNLHNEEYRFLVGKFDRTLSAATCRWCGDTMYSEKSRKEHQGDNCHRGLTDLYRKLLAIKKCVICNAYCTKTYWGIPLCGDNCQEEWRFTMPEFLKKHILGVISKKSEGVTLESI